MPQSSCLHGKELDLYPANISERGEINVVPVSLIEDASGSDVFPGTWARGFTSTLNLSSMLKLPTRNTSGKSSASRSSVERCLYQAIVRCSLYLWLLQMRLCHNHSVSFPGILPESVFVCRSHSQNPHR